jgi:hypothetical protein
MNVPKTAYGILGIPQYYHGLTFEDTKVVPTKRQSITEAINKAPDSGLLLVSGCSAPVVNQLFSLDRKVVGIAFPELFDNRFKEGNNEDYPNAPVVLIYGLGLEAAVNKTFSSTVLQSVLSYYKSRPTLVILETELTPSNFITTYGITVKNTISIPLREEDSWI